MGTETNWARLRQVIVATDDLETHTSALRDAFAFGPGFHDGELADYDMADHTFALADGTYLQLIATHAQDGLARWLAKVGGSAGYAVSIQHPDPAGVRARAHARGVGLIRAQEALGYPIVQLHPRELGLLLEADGIPDRDVWFWDDLGPDAGPTPGAAVDGVVAVVVPVEHPQHLGALWHEVLGLLPGDDPSIVDLGGPRLTFVPSGGTPHWTVVLRRSPAAGRALSPDVIPGISFRYLDAAS